jgi:two-component system, sensor histidine kinase LadS
MPYSCAMLTRISIFFIVALISIGRAYPGKLQPELKVSYLSSSSSLSLEQILSPQYADLFQEGNASNLSLGFSNDIIWLKIEVRNPLPVSADLRLEFGYPLLDQVLFYQKINNQWVVTTYGDQQVFGQRDMAFRNIVIPLNHPTAEWQTYLVEVKSGSSLLFPLSVRYAEDQHRVMRTQELVYGLFYGIMIAMIIYNLFLFFGLREKVYLIYVAAISSSTLFFASTSGHSFQYLWPNFPWWANQVVPLVMGTLAIFSALFAISFLEIRKYSVLMYRLLMLVVVTGSITVVMAFVAPYSITVRLAVILLLVDAIVLLSAGIISWIKGNKSARIFTFAWGAYLTGAILIAFRNLGILPNNFITGHGVEIGSVLEVLLLSLALADKYRLLKIEKEKAQEEALAMQKNINERLEVMVKERTREIERQKEDIESSLIYASRIQNVLIPSRDDMQKLLPKSFVLFKPRDIVSGDFYWISEKSGKVIMAVVDCTGHGVPGAFMSILGHNLLHEIVDVQGIEDPAKVLSYMHYGVRRVLHQDQNDLRDGMDMAICVLDEKSKTIHYAGAKSPMVLVRDGHLEYVKADRLSVGGEQIEEERVFQNHMFTYEKYCSAYFFSDGFQDQFGGPENKKFMIHRLKDLLERVHNKPIETQQTILESTLENWKGKQPQVDDILLVGLKLNGSSR